MKLLSTTALALAFSAAATMAAVNTDAVIAGLQAQGYTSIEVKTGPTQVKVEAIRGVRQLEVVYDKNTGAVLQTEEGLADADEDLTPGVALRSEDDDFTGDDSDEDDADDDSDEDDSDDDSDGDDDAEDDRDDSDGRGRGRGRGGDDGDDD
jgi:phosphopantothenoylcysteine synthetase/decarboxylase